MLCAPPGPAQNAQAFGTAFVHHAPDLGQIVCQGVEAFRDGGLVGEADVAPEFGASVGDARDIAESGADDGPDIACGGGQARNTSRDDVGDVAGARDERVVEDGLERDDPRADGFPEGRDPGARVRGAGMSVDNGNAALVEGRGRELGAEFFGTGHGVASDETQRGGPGARGVRADDGLGAGDVGDERGGRACGPDRVQDGRHARGGCAHDDEIRAPARFGGVEEGGFDDAERGRLVQGSGGASNAAHGIRQVSGLHGQGE